MNKLVSFSRAPGLVQCSKEMLLNTPIKEIPATSIPAYVIPDVISERQEKNIATYMNLLFDRLPFVEGHVDALIHHYKEFYRSGTMLTDERGLGEIDEADESVEAQMTPEVKEDIRKAIVECRELSQSFIPKIPVADRVHFLQLHTSGFIRAHVDESRNSSGMVAGVTLGTARVMSLTHPKFPDAKVDMLLAPRSMYIIAGTARTEWAHSVDWEVDDDDHNNRARVEAGSVVSTTDMNQPVMFEGKPSGFYRGTRNALIFRGVGPMDLFLHKMRQK